MKLVIVHRRRDTQPVAFSFNNPSWVIWETCVRRLAFGNDEFIVEQSERGDEIYTGDHAFRFLLEIVCGLHSPVRGETEVHGQFRQFLNSVPRDSWLKPYLEKAHVQARRVRSEFLHDLGSQSYGSLARRKFRDCGSVDIIGGGQLVRDVLPWLLKMEQTIRIWVRAPEKMSWLSERYPRATYPRLSVHNLNERPIAADGVRGLMVAAPVSAKEIKSWSDSAQVILDFRAESSTDRIAGGSSLVLSLNDIFTEIESTRGRVERQAQQAIDCIQRIAVE